MGDGHGAVGLKQKLRNRLAHQVRAANDQRIEAAQIAQGLFQHDHRAQRRAGRQGWLSIGQQPRIDHMQTVNILGRVYGRDDLITVQMIGQGQLHQNAMDGRIGIQRLDDGHQIPLSRIGGQAAGHGQHPAFLGLLTLIAHIDLAGRILADQHHG